MSIKLGLLASSRQQSASLLLDTYPGAAAAYSIRKLRSAYTGAAIRVRRSNDNAQTDIGFNGSGLLDTTALLTFCGANSGFISIWYDQSGNVKNATQATNATQPRIVASGVLETQNGFAKLVFETMFLSISQVLSSDCFVAFVGNSKLPAAGGVGFITYNSSPNDNPEMYFGINDGFMSYFNGGLALSIINSASTYSIFNFLSSNVSSSITNSVYRNNGLSGSGTRTGIWSTNLNEFTIGKYVRTGAYKNGQIQELVVYNSNQSSNRVGINTNINSFYSIYIVPPVVSDPDAQEFVNRVFAAGGSVTSTEANAVNTLTIGLKANGIWNLLKAIYPMVGSSAASCSQNLKSSSFTGSFINGWTFSTTGATPNGIDAYMNTNFNIGTELTQTNSHASFYSRTINDNVNYPTVIGAYGTSSYTQALELYMRRVFPGDKGGGQLGSFTSSVINFTETDARKFAIISRTSATSLKYYTNGILRATDTNSDTTGFGNVTAYISAGNYVTGTPQNFSRLECAFASLGNGLSDSESLDFYNLVQTFQTTLSRQV